MRPPARSVGELPTGCCPRGTSQRLSRNDLPGLVRSTCPKNSVSWLPCSQSGPNGPATVIGLRARTKAHVTLGACVLNEAGDVVSRGRGVVKALGFEPCRNVSWYVRRNRTNANLPRTRDRRQHSTAGVSARRRFDGRCPMIRAAVVAWARMGRNHARFHSPETWRALNSCAL